MTEKALLDQIKRLESENKSVIEINAKLLQKNKTIQSQLSLKDKQIEELKDWNKTYKESLLIAQDEIIKHQSENQTLKKQLEVAREALDKIKKLHNYECINFAHHKTAKQALNKIQELGKEG